MRLDFVFSIKHPRRVNKDNTVRYCRGIYQLLPVNGSKSLAGKWVEVCELWDGRLKILWEGKRIGYAEITGSNEAEEERLKAKEEILNLRISADGGRKPKGRKKYIPSANHPWRRGWKQYVTFSRSNKV